MLVTSVSTVEAVYTLLRLVRLSDIDTDAIVVILHIRLQILFLLFLKVGEGKSVGKCMVLFHL